MRGPHLLLFGALVGVAALAPAFATDLQLFRFTNVLVYAIALLGLNILVGYNGQISLGHGAFYAIGAYATATLVTHAGLAHWAAIPVSGAISFAAGFLFALPVLRLGTMHLAMATFAVGDLDCDGTLITYTLDLTVTGGEPAFEIIQPLANAD